MKYDLIVIGGGPAGSVSAMTARMFDQKKSILVIKNIEQGVVPCGIPYMFKTLKKPDDNTASCEAAAAFNIEIKHEDVIKINKKEQIVETASNNTYKYNKLIIATGSNPIFPPIPGIDKKGIYTIKKELTHLKGLYKDIKKAKDIVIVGGGFIGIEFADELAQFKNKNITVIELMPEILMASFDKEISSIAKGILKKAKINLLTEKKVIKFNGNDRIESVSISKGKDIKAQVVILGIGAFPNTKIAKDSDIEVNERSAIKVDKFQRTKDKNIFAVGDCSEKTNILTKTKAPILLASTATTEARIAGYNAVVKNQKLFLKNKGVIPTSSTKIGNIIFGSAGLTEEFAKQNKINIIIGNAQSPDKHPATMPDVTNMQVKLIFSKKSNELIGGQVVGGESAGELINVISLAIQKSMTAQELGTLLVATHPKLTAAPTSYPLILAAQNALIKMQ